MYKSKSGYETDNYGYMIISNINEDKDLHRIYKLNRATGKITLVNEKHAEVLNTEMKDCILSVMTGALFAILR